MRPRGIARAAAQTRWWKLQRADVGAHRGVRARLPLLDEVLSLVPFSMRVNVELKCDTVVDRGRAVEVAARLRARGEGERIIVSSFNPLCLLRFAAAAPHVARGWLIDPDKAYWPQAHLWLPLVRPGAVHPFHGQTTPARVAAWREQGRAVHVWTVDDAEVARDLRGLGVAAVITNRPGALREELRR